MFADQIGLRFVIYFVEIDTESFVRFVETGIHPLVHGAPQVSDFLVAGLPAAQHILCFEHQRCLFFGIVFGQAFAHQLFDLFAILLVETHIVVAHEVVAFFAARLRCFAVAKEFPRQHRFADVYAAVVDDVGFHHAPAVGLLYFADAIAQKIVAHMSQMQRFIGIRRRVFHHHERRVVGRCAVSELRIGIDFVQHVDPISIADGQIQESFHGIEIGHKRRVLLKVFADFGGGLFGRFACHFHKREHDDGYIAGELFFGFLHLHRIGGCFGAVQCFDGFGN